MNLFPLRRTNRFSHYQCTGVATWTEKWSPLIKSENFRRFLCRKIWRILDKSLKSQVKLPAKYRLIVKSPNLIHSSQFMMCWEDERDSLLELDAIGSFGLSTKLANTVMLCPPCIFIVVVVLCHRHQCKPS